MELARAERLTKAMYTAAQLRLLARDHRSRATVALQPAAQAMLLRMATEFDRDAEIAAREERRASNRVRAEQAEVRAEAVLADLAA